MSVKTKSKDADKRAVVLTSIRRADVSRLKRISESVGMKRVEYIARVLDRDENKSPSELSVELLTAGK